MKKPTEKEIKRRVFRLLDKHGKLIKEPYARYIDEELVMDFVRLVKSLMEVRV